MLGIVCNSKVWLARLDSGGVSREGRGLVLADGLVSLASLAGGRWLAGDQAGLTFPAGQARHLR